MYVLFKTLFIFQEPLLHVRIAGLVMQMPSGKKVGSEMLKEKGIRTETERG
jgi:hypothetical protein